MATSLKNVNLIVSDMARAADFYVRILGLPVDEKRSAPPDFLFLSAGPGGLTLQDAEAAGETAGAAPGVEIGFEVTDLDAIAAALSASGYGDPAVQSMGWGRALSVRDPEGHRLNLFMPAERW